MLLLLLLLLLLILVQSWPVYPLSKLVRPVIDFGGNRIGLVDAWHLFIILFAAVIGIAGDFGANEMQTSPTCSISHCKPNATSVSSGWYDAHPLPYTKNGCVGSVSM